MSRLPRVLGPVLFGLAALAGSPASMVDEVENLRQLQAMPRERRIALSENLERFDKLDPAEQAAIRKLDAEIFRKNSVEQAQYRSLLRRYHLWVVGLTEEQRTELKSAEGPEARLNLARKFRKKERENGATGPKVFGIRTGDFGVTGPYEIAYLLRVWKLLTPAKKLELDRQRERGALFKAIAAEGKLVGVAHQTFPTAEEVHYDAILNGDENFKAQLGPFAKRVNATPLDAEPPAKAKAHPHKFELRFAEFLYFEDHKPIKVAQANLERFSDSCPGWLHEMLDPLSPDDARAYLTIVYRLLYPEPGEMPAEAKPAKPSEASKPPTERPAPKKSGPAGPF